MINKQLLLSISVFFFASITLPAMAQNNSSQLYQLEVLIFKYLNINDDEEHWPAREKDSFSEFKIKQAESGLENQDAPQNKKSAKTNQNNTEDTAIEALIELSPSLEDTAQDLASKEHYEVVFHNTWHQTLDHKNKADAIYLSLGKVISDEPELEGTLKFYRSRYVHVEVNLWLKHLLKNKKEEANPEESLFNFYEVSGLEEDNSDQAHDEQSNKQQSFRYVALKHSRRIKDSKLHYIDHPLLGVLVRVNKVEMPEESPAIESSEETLDQ